MVTGVFSETRKHALVVSIYKKGDPDSVNNYIPLSILPVISKVLEKYVAKQLSFYLESHNLLSESQHSFLPRLSKETALTTVTDKLYENKDKKKVSQLTLGDLSHAFDTVDHDILLNKGSLLNTSRSTWRCSGQNDIENELKLNVITPLSNFVFIDAMVVK